MNESSLWTVGIGLANVAFSGDSARVGCAQTAEREIRCLQIAHAGNNMAEPPHWHAARRREVVDDSEFAT